MDQNLQNMIQQAQKMQTRMESLQKELGELEVEGSAGGGIVRVVISCRGEMKQVHIEQELINDGDKEMIEDLVKAANNDARTRADQRMAEETRKVMQEMGMPMGAGGQLPF